MLSPGVFVHAQVVDVQAFLIHEHRVVLRDFQNAEAVAQQLPVLHGGKNRAVGVLQQGFQSPFIVFLSTVTEQVRADFVMDLPHLKQQINHAGNVPGICHTDFHKKPSFSDVIMFYFTMDFTKGKAGG